MTGRFRALFHPIGLVLVLALAGTGPLPAQENPMTVLPSPADDEPESALPESAPPASTPSVPGAVPVVRAGEPPAPAAGTAYPLHDAPLPPARPWVLTRPAAVASTAPAAPVASAPVAAAPVPPVAAAHPPEDGAPAVPAPESAPAEEAAAAGLPASGGEDAGAPETRLASLPTITQPSTTAEIEDEETRAPEPMLVEKQTDAVDIACIQPEVMKLVRLAGEHFGATPIITSGQRNRGRRGSYHRKCMAADFFVPGIERARLAKYLRTLPGAGGVGTYCHTKSVHIDIGEARNWWQCGFRFRFAQR
jgi:hypothetical protein